MPSAFKRMHHSYCLSRCSIRTACSQAVGSAVRKRALHLKQYLLPLSIYIPFLQVKSWNHTYHPQVLRVQCYDDSNVLHVSYLPALFRRNAQTLNLRASMHRYMRTFQPTDWYVDTKNNVPIARACAVLLLLLDNKKQTLQSHIDRNNKDNQ